MTYEKRRDALETYLEELEVLAEERSLLVDIEDVEELGVSTNVDVKSGSDVHATTDVSDSRSSSSDNGIGGGVIVLLNLDGSSSTSVEAELHTSGGIKLEEDTSLSDVAQGGDTEVQLGDNVSLKVTGGVESGGSRQGQGYERSVVKIFVRSLAVSGTYESCQW